MRVCVVLTREALTDPAVRPDGKCCSHVVSAIIHPHVRYSLPLCGGSMREGFVPQLKIRKVFRKVHVTKV